jgi:hypothetical protein
MPPVKCYSARAPPPRCRGTIVLVLAQRWLIILLLGENDLTAVWNTHFPL